MKYLVAIAVAVWLYYRFFRINDSEIPVKYRQDAQEEDDNKENISRPAHNREKNFDLVTNDSMAQPPPLYTDKDNWEGYFQNVEAPIQVNATLRIDYRDGAGQETTRTVEVSQLGSWQNSDMIIGHCRMRNQTRTFRTDRILTCVDEDTGEVVGNVSRHLRNRYERSPEKSRDLLFENEYDVIRILLYVGKADGQLRAAEKDIICDACRSLAQDERITVKMVDDLLANTEIPSIHAFKLAVGRVAKSDIQKLKNIHQTIVAIVKTQKTIHPSEQEAIDYIDKVLSKTC